MDPSDISAAMPSLEAKKLPFRKLVGGRQELRNGRWCQQKIMLNDVKKAHLHDELEDHESAPVLPPDGECEQEKCWKLRRWLYGMRSAASALEKHCSKTHQDMGFAKGLTAAPDIRCVVRVLFPLGSLCPSWSALLDYVVCLARSTRTCSLHFALSLGR